MTTREEALLFTIIKLVTNWRKRQMALRKFDESQAAGLTNSTEPDEVGSSPRAAPDENGGHSDADSR